MTAPDERDVELLPDDDPPDDEPIAEETTNPAIERELLLAGLGEEVDRKENPLDAIGEAARDNPDAIDALLEGLDEPPPEPPKIPTTRPSPPPDDEDEFYSRFEKS